MRFFTTLFIIAISVNTFGQIDKPIVKGNFLFGGMFSGSTTHSTNPDSKEYQIDISPNFGYFIIDNLALGLYSDDYYIWKKTFHYKDYALSIGPFTKYYFHNGLLLGLSGSYGKGYELDYSFYSIFPQLGYSIFINSKVSLEFIIYYNIKFAQNSYIDNSYGVISTKIAHNREDIFGFQIGFQIFR